jgi:molecular chaperone GrpE
MNMPIFEFIKRRIHTMTHTDANSTAQFDDALEELDQNAIDETAAEQQDDSVAALQSELDSWKDKALRLAADMDNLRKRAQRDQEDALKYGISSGAKQFLSVADNLERAINSVPVDSIAQSDVLANLLSGIEATQKELLSALQKVGVSQIPAKLGDVLNPQIHEVMFDVPIDQQQPGTLIHILETGYMLHDRLLRPARVAVSKNTSAQKTDKEVDFSA